MIRIPSLVLAAFTAFAVDQSAPPVFRTAAEVVVIDAAVMDGAKPVTGLAREDFELRDNGVVQQLIDFDTATLPLDVTLMIDISGSMTPVKREIVRRAVGRVNSALRPADRVRIVTFGSHIAERVLLQPPPVAFTLPDVEKGTAVFDALLFSIATPAEDGRRHLSVLMTDGNDTTSFFDSATVLETAKHAHIQLSFVVTRSQEPSDRSFAQIRGRRSVTMATLKTAAEWTGGRLVELDRDDRLGEAFLSAIQAFRSSYVLRYAPAGGAAAGWHNVSVTMKEKKYTVRAKRGYWAGERR
jgi:hypothetical protein